MRHPPGRSDAGIRSIVRVGSRWCIRKSPLYARSNAPSSACPSTSWTSPTRTSTLSSSERRRDRSSALHRGLAEVDAHNLPLWPDHLGHDGECSKRSTTAIGYPPPWLHADL